MTFNQLDDAVKLAARIRTVEQFTQLLRSAPTLGPSAAELRQYEDAMSVLPPERREQVRAALTAALSDQAGDARAAFARL